MAAHPPQNPQSILDVAKASLASALDDPDMDLAANSHSSAKLRCTNFSLSTGNSTNRFINTKQYAITHKSRALALATEIRKSAQLEHENRDMACRLQELEALYSSSPNQLIAPPPVDPSKKLLKNPPELPTACSPHPPNNKPEAIQGRNDDDLIYHPTYGEYQKYQIHQDTLRALENFGEPPFESEAEREHTTSWYIQRDRSAIQMGITVAHLLIDTFNDDDELWITVNREAALQMDPGDQSEPDIVIYEQVQLANKNWNDLLELHVKYWENGTMLQSRLDQLLTKREALAVEYIMFTIDPFATPRLRKHNQTYPCYEKPLQNWEPTPATIGVPAPSLSTCKQWNNGNVTYTMPHLRQKESTRKDSTK
jgi:hypothetical protein